MYKETYDIKKFNPHFIHELDNGNFGLVNKINLNEDGRWVFETFEETGELEIGNEIIEIPNRNLSIVVRSYKNSLIKSIITELRKFGKLTLSDYVTYETFGVEICKYLSTEGDFDVMEVKPRIFRKYVND